MFGDGREYDDGSSSSSMFKEPRAARASSAPAARTEEPSLLLLGRCFSEKSTLPDPAVEIAVLAARSGMKRSPA